jgi:hypothetical protein
LAGIQAVISEDSKVQSSMTTPQMGTASTISSAFETFLEKHSQEFFNFFSTTGGLGARLAVR